LYRAFQAQDSRRKNVGGMIPPCPDVPKPFTSWAQVLQTRELQRLLEQQAQHSVEKCNALHFMSDQEADFPALKDLRPEEGQ
jgi:hypothetical protein